MDFGGDIGIWQRRLAECNEGLERRNATLKAMEIEPGKTYLDVGCGGGHLVRDIGMVLGNEGRVVGLDATSEQISGARDLCEGMANIEFVEGDATKMDFPDASFDGLASIQTLDYIPDVNAALLEARRVLKQGSRITLVCVLWDHWRFHGPEDDLNNQILNVFREHCAHQMLPLGLPGLLIASGFENVKRKQIAFFNDKFEESVYSYWAAKVAAHFAIGQGVPEQEVQQWFWQLEDANKSNQFGFVSVPIVTTAVAA
ncbi:methyltransferase domain-containing protein [Pseudomonadota bacterium]